MLNFTVSGLLLFVLVQDIVQRINRSLDKGSAGETHELLQMKEGKFPTVRNRSALLYHNGLREVKQQLKVTFVSYVVRLTKAVGFSDYLIVRLCCLFIRIFHSVQQGNFKSHCLIRVPAVATCFNI